MKSSLISYSFTVIRSVCVTIQRGAAGLRCHSREITVSDESVLLSGSIHYATANFTSGTFYPSVVTSLRALARSQRSFFLQKLFASLVIAH